MAATRSRNSSTRGRVATTSFTITRYRCHCVRGELEVVARTPMPTTPHMLFVIYGIRAKAWCILLHAKASLSRSYYSSACGMARQAAVNYRPPRLQINCRMSAWLNRILAQSPAPS
jgi:hypothetical protein